MATQGELIAAAQQARRQISHGIHAEADPAWAQIDLPLNQLKALFVLTETPLPMSQLGERLGIGRPACTHLVERLVQAGLVGRAEDPLDRRRTIVTITPAADDLVAQLRQGGQRRVNAWLSRLALADLAALVQGLDALARVASAGQSGQLDAGNVGERTSTSDMHKE